MSHELRTPLNAIDGMAYLVRRDGLTPDQAERMNKLEQASRNLLALIDRVLQLARLEDGKLELSPVVFSLPLLVQKALDLVGDSAREKGLTLTLDFPDMPERLRGDVAYISQILLNYLGNAIKFTQQGSVTLVGRVRQETDKDLLIRFDVQDTGIGLNEEQMARLFTAFEQGDNSNTRNYGGSGLGLAINYR
jgi:signal transduction histidine kinase